MSKPIQADLKNKIAVVTGANTGMGRETARELARLGATVILACRNKEKAQAARDDIVSSTGNQDVQIMELDLSSLASIRGFARALNEKHPALHILVNNAAMWTQDRQLSNDGIELQWATNVVGTHALITALQDALIRGSGRIVNVASSGAFGLDLSDVQYAKRAYNGFTAYTATKQALRMLTWSWAEKLQGKVTVNACNPGLVTTELNRNIRGPLKLMFKLFSPMAKTARDGADTTIWLAAAPGLEGKTGAWFEKRKEGTCKFREPGARQKLWDLVESQANSARDARAAQPAAAPAVM